MERSLGKGLDNRCPYRETREQIDKWASEDALAVKMQTASLFAFAIARHASVASVVMVSNAVDHQGEQFDTGSPDDGFRILQGIARAAR
jgi:uridine phosphorylase